MVPVLAICRRYFYPRIFFLLLRTFLQFHEGIAGMICDVSSSLGKFRAGIAGMTCDVSSSLGKFRAGIAGMTCDVSSSLGKFRAGIAPIVMLPVLALLRRQCSICCVVSLGHFSHSLLEL
jgi:hypothetical protein